jgi:hypothetical protein
MTGLESLSPKQRATAQRVIAEAKAQGVPAELAYGMAMQESGFDQSKKSKTGPTGVMMLGKAAAKDMGVNRHNEMENIRGGVAYMKQMLDKYQGDVDKALIAYHDGPNSAYFSTGQASPAAINHIQKVKGYAGMATPTTSVVKVPPAQEAKSKFNIELEDVEPLDVTGLAGTTAPAQGFGRQRDISDVMTGGAGAMAGFAFGPDKPMSKKRMDQMRIQIAADRAARDAQAQAQAAATAKNPQFGSGKDAWIANQHAPLLAQPLFGQPSQAAAGAAEPAARAQLEKALKMAPNMAPAGPDSLIALTNTVGQGNKVLPAPVVAPTPAGGLPVTQPKPINFGSRPGQLANTAGGGIALTQVNDMAQRVAQGDYTGGALSGVSATGAGLMTAPVPPKAKLAGAAISAGGAGLQYLYDLFKTDDQTKSVLQPEGEAPKYKKGGAIKKPDGGLSAVEHFDGGGRTGLAKTVAGKIAGAFGQAPGQLVMPTAEEIAKFTPKPTKQLKFSEAIRPYQDQYLGVHMSDRQGVHGNRWGGTGFPNFQNINPLHSANKAVWMNDSEEAANRLIQSSREFNGRPMVNTNYIGALDQHRSNKTVFNDILDTFYKNQAAGQITPEQIEKINQAILSKAKTTGTLKNLPFNDKFDIRDKDAVKAIAGETFEGRKAIGDLLGTGIGTRKPPTVPQYSSILDAHAEPFTKGAPTSAVGTRLFKVDNVPAQYTDDVLHPDYRWKVTGEDQQVQFPAVPQNIAVRDWYNEIKPRIGMEPHGNAWFSYPKRPQLISKDYITMAEDAGYAEGGLTGVPHYDKGGRTGVLTRLGESAYDILKLTPEKIEAWRKANAKPFKQQQDPQLAQALEAYMTGKISQADYLRIMNERRPIRPLTEVPAAHSDTDIASALLSNQVEKKGILGVNLFAPQGMRVGNRLDIPAYERYGTYVDTMHDPAGKPIAYGHTGHLKNVEFQSDPNRAIRVGLGTREQKMTPLAAEEGQGKAPFAMMVGDNQVTSNDEVRRMLAEALRDPSWTQVGMNPYRGSQFYDKADMQPVFSAAEKIQAGPLVLARDVEKTSWKDPRLKTKYGVNYAQGGLTHL